MKYLYLFVFLLWSVSLIFLGRSCSKTEVSTETVVIVDTIKDTVPHLVTEKVLEVKTLTKVLTDTISTPGIVVYRDTDSLHLQIQKVQRYYKDSLYQAWVSGIDPSLDSIYVTKTTIKTYEKVPEATISLEPFILYNRNISAGVACDYRISKSISAFGGISYDSKWSPVLGVKYKIKLK